MSVQEILAKDIKRWKYKECQEIIDSSEATADQKVTAQERQQAIKQWLDQNKGGPTSTNATPTHKASFTPAPTTRIDTTKIDINASDKDSIRKIVDRKLNIILVQQAHIDDRLTELGINNPALAGMLLKLVRDDNS
jgi:hypothetical protein